MYVIHVQYRSDANDKVTVMKFGILIVLLYSVHFELAPHYANTSAQNKVFIMLDHSVDQMKFCSDNFKFCSDKFKS